jgi:acyl carrier protein
VANFDECLEIVREALGRYAPADKAMADNVDLVGDLGLSSLQVLEVVTDIEDRLDISLPLNELPNVSTVEELARLLEAASTGSQA